MGTSVTPCEIPQLAGSQSETPQCLHLSRADPLGRITGTRPVADRHWARGDAMLAKGVVLTRRGVFSDAEPLRVASESIARSGGERHRPRRDRAVKALVDLYEQWNTREPSSDRAGQLERWRKALPME